MKRYIGTKTLTAKPMTLGEYNRYRKWEMPNDEDPEAEGYLVEYPYDEQTTPNHENHIGYISWSPKHVFDVTYKSEGNWNFGHALEMIMQGRRVQRSGWNGKNMFLFLVKGSTFEVNREPLLSILGEGAMVNYHGHIDMKTADGTIVPWLCSQTDMQATDWSLA